MYQTLFHKFPVGSLEVAVRFDRQGVHTLRWLTLMQIDGMLKILPRIQVSSIKYKLRFILIARN